MPRTSYHASITSTAGPEGPPYRDHYPAALPDGTWLNLPLQPLPGGEQAIALLMSNQTPFEVEQRLGALLSRAAADFSPEVIAGVPTMGLDYARIVARELGLPHYVALGNSRKFWYTDTLSVAVRSVTSPGAPKRLYLDPMLLERLAGRRTLVIDDVVSTGASAAAAIELLHGAGAVVIGLCVVLTEGNAWREALQSLAPDWPSRVRSLGRIPIFRSTAAGWVPE